jgi:acyl-[acyl-carrier-protein]-phospholipid O-acyltransferase/long-chain-fatty-acid--[acyl-carrier-protein] ligase
VQNHGVAELAVPRRVVQVEEIPLLSTGKTDYPSVTRLVTPQSDNAGTALAS